MAKRDGPICLFSDQKNIRKAYVKKLYTLTISVCYRIFFEIDRCSEIILATAKFEFRIIFLKMSPYIQFVAGESLGSL